MQLGDQHRAHVMRVEVVNPFRHGRQRRLLVPAAGEEDAAFRRRSGYVDALELVGADKRDITVI